ncbi:hypothetical protein BS47DRAFT_1451614 [Hydnum rufescens UP504]|uniref:Clathrin/coatomer adaptor adaptin-like N-terminal domain-containing protein n=1 Tax=Hydnum rufescens UP504 TaxID=1448309 RepID=A0A9P6B9C2_9AGAM|nr:hypothetical protein BS47DRAFT_1451614 [Hydnum rufescens UP504]
MPFTPLSRRSHIYFAWPIIMTFERTLSDLIRGLQASSKKDEPEFISLAINDVRSEVRSKDMELKAAAILKLTYLDMLGYDMSWASFHVVEDMSSSKIHLKAVGYLTAVQSFKVDTDVIMLTTNTLKKDIASPHPADTTISLDSLSYIVTPDLGRDLSHDLIAMLNHSRPRIHKCAILMMYKVLMKYPEVLPHSFNPLREKLDDPIQVWAVSATVNVLCELARRDAQYYLPFAPQLFDIVSKSSNNWMLIKVIKLLGSLAPFEPCLVKKLQKPVTDLISTTPAVSLLYGCVHTCTIGGMVEGPGGNSLAKTCIDKLAAFLRDPDQNYEIISSIEDHDISIRTRALDLVSSMVTDHNLQSIVHRLLAHPAVATSDMSLAIPVTVQIHQLHPRHSPPLTALEFAEALLPCVLTTAYENVTDFECDDVLLENCPDPTSCSEVLELVSPQEPAPLLLQPNIMLLPEETIVVYLQSALKIFGHWAAGVSKHSGEGLLPDIKDQADKMISSLDRFTASSHIEVQEQSSDSSLPPLPKTSWAEPSFPKSLYLIRPLHAHVRVPEGLDLGIRIVPLSRFKVEGSGIIASNNEEDIEDAPPTANRRKKGKGKAEDKSAKEKCKGTKRK